MSNQNAQAIKPIQPQMITSTYSEESQPKETDLKNDLYRLPNEFEDDSTQINRTVNQPKISSEPKPSWHRHYSMISSSVDTRSRAFKWETFGVLSSPKHHSGTPTAQKRFDDSLIDSSGIQSFDSKGKMNIKSYRRRSSSKTRRKGFRRQGESPVSVQMPNVPVFHCSVKPQFASNGSPVIEYQKKIIRETKNRRVSYLERIRSFN